MSSFYPLKALTMPLSTHSSPTPPPIHIHTQEEMIQRRHRDGRNGSKLIGQRKKMLTLTTEMTGVAKALKTRSRLEPGEKLKRDTLVKRRRDRTGTEFYTAGQPGRGHLLSTIRSSVRARIAPSFMSPPVSPLFFPS
jgi:hypothetical protein